jgi:hypothetical protein
MFGHASGNRIPDVLIAWNEPDRSSDGEIGPKISSRIAGESEESMTAAAPAEIATTNGTTSASVDDSICL